MRDNTPKCPRKFFRNSCESAEIWLCISATGVKCTCAGVQSFRFQGTLGWGTGSSYCLYILPVTMESDLNNYILATKSWWLGKSGKAELEKRLTGEMGLKRLGDTLGCSGHLKFLSLGSSALSGHLSVLPIQYPFSHLVPLWELMRGVLR